MKIKEKAKTFDKKLSKKYDSYEKSLIFRMIIKLFGEVILACFVAFAVYIATSIYDDSRLVDRENHYLDRVNISSSDEYIESLFGTPIVKEEDNNELVNSFFLLDNAVLRTVSKKGSVIAFFITSQKESRKIPFKSYKNDRLLLGKITYAKHKEYDEFLRSDYCISGQGRINYYCEFFPTGRTGRYNTFVLGTVSYGFSDDSAKQLLLDARDNPEQENISFLRKKAKPNTYGIISLGYEDNVCIIPQGSFSSGGWLDIYSTFPH